MDFQTMNKQRKLMLIFSLIGLIAMFLPWVRISFLGMGTSVNGMHDMGIVIFICFLGCGLLSLAGKQDLALDKSMWLISIILSGVAALIMIIFFFKSTDVMSFLSFGFYIAAIAALGLLFIAYQYRAPGYNIRDSFDELKKKVDNKSSN